MMDVLSFISVIIGILGTVFGVLQWRELKRRDRIYKYLFSLAEKNIDKKVNEEEIASLSTQVQQLREQIQKDIPLAAKRAALQDRLETETEHLYNTFQTIQRIQKQLTEMGGTLSLPKDFLTEIEHAIQPQYLVKQKISALKTKLLVVTIAASIISNVFSSFFMEMVGHWLSMGILLAALPYFFQLAVLSFGKEEFKKIMYEVGSIACAVAGTSLAAIGWELNYNHLIGGGIIFILLSAFFARKYVSYKRILKKQD